MASALLAAVTALIATTTKEETLAAFMCAFQVCFVCAY